MTYEEVFKELDGAARANLSDKGVRAYEIYKARLIERGTIAPEGMDAILRGWIWDESESESWLAMGEHCG